MEFRDVAVRLVEKLTHSFRESTDADRKPVLPLKDIPDFVIQLEKEANLKELRDGIESNVRHSGLDPNSPQGKKEVEKRLREMSTDWLNQ